MPKSPPLILALILSLAITPFAFGQTPAPLPDLASAGWSVKQVKELNSESNEAVWKFMNDRWGNSDLSRGNGKVCTFQFADLRHSGYLSLVVSYDGGGTADCNDVEIYDKSASGVAERDFQAYSNGAYFGSIQDLGGDGHLELIVDKCFAAAKYTEDGSNCLATQSVIYAWDGHSYVDVSTKYPRYYRQELARLRKQIGAAESPRVRSGNGAKAGANGPGTTAAKPPPSPTANANAAIAGGTVNVVVGFAPNYEPPAAESESDDSGNLDCAQAEADQDMRILGISRDAGIADAIRWAASDNQRNRDFARSVLSDMGIPAQLDADGYVYAKGQDGVIKITRQFKYRPGMFEFKRPRTWPPPATD